MQYRFASCSGLFVHVEGLVDVVPLRAQTLHMSTTVERQKGAHAFFLKHFA